MTNEVRKMGRRAMAALGAVAALWLGAAGPAAAQETLCDDPTEQCGKLISPDCLQRVGAGSLAAEAPAICAAQLEVYQSCLALVANNCAAAPTRAVGGSAPNQSAATSAVEPQTEDGFVFSLRDCTRAAEGLVCRVIVRNTEPDRQMSVYGANTRGGNVAQRALLYDASGVSHPPKAATIAGQEIGNYLAWSFPQELGVELRLTFDPAGFEGVSSAPLLRINFWRANKYYAVNLRDLPLQ